MPAHIRNTCGHRAISSITEGIYRCRLLSSSRQDLRRDECGTDQCNRSRRRADRDFRNGCVPFRFQLVGALDRRDISHQLGTGRVAVEPDVAVSEVPQDVRGGYPLVERVTDSRRRDVQVPSVAEDLEGYLPVPRLDFYMGAVWSQPIRVATEHMRHSVPKSIENYSSRRIVFSVRQIGKTIRFAELLGDIEVFRCCLYRSPISSPLIRAISFRQDIADVLGYRLDYRHGHRVTELLVGGRIGEREGERVGEPLEPRPFARRHPAYVLAANFALDVGDRRVVGDAVVDDEVPLPPHAAAHDGSRLALGVADDVAESVPERLVLRLVPAAEIEVGGTQVIFSRYRPVLEDIGYACIAVCTDRELE